MKLKMYKTLWGHNGPHSDAINQAISAGFHGIEGPAPLDDRTNRDLYYQLKDSNLEYIAEITTAGSYVPDRHASMEQHLESFELKLEASLKLDPQFITCLGGCDAWPEEKNTQFFHEAMEMADAADVTISFETHRGRAFFNPWVTQRIIEQLPDIKITCDFSHWCVVCERLMDTEMEVLHALAPHAHHIHARVGYDQGPQVPHPAAPEYETELKAHQTWWEMIWQQQLKTGYPSSTLTPEFGPDRYLHEMPFSKQAVADLWDINCWMAEEERQHFSRFIKQYS